jgi:hypothetical protein
MIRVMSKNGFEPLAAATIISRVKKEMKESEEEWN